ncbi:MAG: hypothetical protein Q8R24_08870 [Legionellaceae bacterium]|nr:hypothetical protein [Legionellaceae bacterium]
MKTLAEKVNPIYFGVCMWGRSFCELFVNYALASMLAEKNIPALDNSARKNCFLICTTKNDWEWLQRQATIKLLERYIDIDFIEITPISEEAYKKLNNRLNSHKLYIMTMGHRLILNRMYKDKAVGSIVFPDSIYANNAISSAYKHIADGKTSVLVHCPRFSTTSIIEELCDLKFVTQGDPLSIEPRALVQVAMRHLHIDIRMQQWDAPYFPEFLLEPSWILPDNAGMLFYTWNCWYAFINYANLASHNISTLGDNSIDGVYFDANLKPNEAHFIEDSDEYALITFSPHIHRTIKPIHRISYSVSSKNMMDLIKINFTKQKINGSMGMHMGQFKMEFASKPIYWHSKELTPACYQLQAQSQMLIQKSLYGKLTFIDKIKIDISNTHNTGLIKRKIINNIHLLFSKLLSLSYRVLRRLKRSIVGIRNIGIRRVVDFGIRRTRNILKILFMGPKYIFKGAKHAVHSTYQIVSNNRHLFIGMTLFATGAVLGVTLTLLVLLLRILKV